MALHRTAERPPTQPPWLSASTAPGRASLVPGPGVRVPGQISDVSLWSIIDLFAKRFVQSRPFVPSQINLTHHSGILRPSIRTTSLSKVPIHQRRHFLAVLSLIPTLPHHTISPSATRVFCKARRALSRHFPPSVGESHSFKQPNPWMPRSTFYNYLI